MRAIAGAVLVFVALSACSRQTNTSVTTVNEPAAAVNTPTATASTNDPFVGSYRLAGADDRDKGTLVIAKAGEAYTAAIDIGAPGCGGQAKGAAIRTGEALQLIARVEETALKCEVEIKREGESLMVTEGAGCSNFHGASCDLNGTAARK